MAKSTCLLVLFVAVVVCAEAVRIDPVQPSPRGGRYIPNYNKNDPRCPKTNGLYPYPGDCTMYIKCYNGDSQERKCPEDFKFDTIRHCIPPRNKPDCGKKMHGPLDADEKCPKSYGIFPVKSDCHKFMTCREGVPTIEKCPEHQFYRDINGACVDGDKCPKQIRDEESICKRANELLPDELNCRRYIKCVNFQPMNKECPPGKAFDPEKKICTPEQLLRCRNNDIMHVLPDE